jgi:hypothetical protein
MLFNWLSRGEHSSNAALKESMRSAQQLRGHLDRIKLMQSMFNTHPLPDVDAQRKLLSDVDVEVKRILIGDALYVGQSHHAVLPSVQNLSDSYAIQRQRHLDAQRLAFKDQQIKIHESLVEHSQSERIRSSDEENDDAAATASLENTSGVSSGSTGSSLTTLTDEPDSKSSMSEVRNLLKRRVDYQNAACTEFMETCKLTQAGSLDEKTVYSSMVRLFVINTKATSSSSSFKRGLAECLDYFSKENSTAVVFASPDYFELWRSIFCEITSKEKKWYWVNTIILLPDYSNNPNNLNTTKLRTVAEQCMIFSRNKTIDVNMEELMTLYESDAEKPASFNSNVVHNVKVIPCCLCLGFL